MIIIEWGWDGSRDQVQLTTHREERTMFDMIEYLMKSVLYCQPLMMAHAMNFEKAREEQFTSTPSG